MLHHHAPGTQITQINNLIISHSNHTALQPGSYCTSVSPVCPRVPISSQQLAGRVEDNKPTQRRAAVARPLSDARLCITQHAHASLKQGVNEMKSPDYPRGHSTLPTMVQMMSWRYPEEYTCLFPTVPDKLCQTLGEDTAGHGCVLYGKKYSVHTRTNYATNNMTGSHDSWQASKCFK